MMSANHSNSRQEQGSNMFYSKIIRRGLLASFAAVAMSASAMAQSTILIVDQNRVLRDSEVGKHIKRQLESIGKSMESEMKASTQPLTSERDRLVNELKTMDASAMQTRPDLQKRAQDLMQKGQKQQVEAAYKQRELQITEGKALKQVNDRLAKILETIVAERGADIILDRGVVIYGGKTADVTDTVLSRLNSQMRTVTVARERLPRKQ